MNSTFDFHKLSPMRLPNASGFHLFTLFGTPVTVQMSYILLHVVWPFVQSSSSGGGELSIAASWVIAIFLSLLVHEFGHVYANRTNGAASSVVFWAMGGMTYSDGYQRTRGWPRIWVSLAGPFAGFCLWAIFWFLLMPQNAVDVGMRTNVHAMFDRTTMLLAILGDRSSELKTWHFFWVDMCYLNLFWGLINLLPIFPLDGGQALEEALRFRFRAIEANRISAIISIIVIGGVIAWEVTRPAGDRSTIFVVILAMLGFQNFQRMNATN